MSIILLKPILVKDGVDPMCVDDTTHFTDPILEGEAASGGLMPSAPTGDNVFNLYQANPNGVAGSDDGYRNPSPQSSRVEGNIRFGVTPCAEKIDIEVVGRNDVYGSGFDTCIITVDNVDIRTFESTDDDSYTIEDGKYVPALSGTNSISETVTHNFAEPKVCGHIVNIYGKSGSIANNNVGYDVKITVTLRTTPIT